MKSGVLCGWGPVHGIWQPELGLFGAARCPTRAYSSMSPPLPLPTERGCCQPLHRLVKAENSFEALFSCFFKASLAWFPSVVCVNVQVSWPGERMVDAGAGPHPAFLGSVCSLGSGCLCDPRDLIRKRLTAGALDF